MNNPQISERLRNKLKEAQRVVVLTGAGISAESGIPTFRGESGMWKNFRPEELATPEAFARNPELVWQWYDWRRSIIGGCAPNPGHRVLVELEGFFPEFWLVTQNIDGLHQKAGNRNILELHGNIWNMRCTREGTLEENMEVPLKTVLPHCSSCGALLRPNVVWFGEALPVHIMERSFEVTRHGDLFFIIGTSGVVYPAAALPSIAQNNGAFVVEINTARTPLSNSADEVLIGKAGEVLPEILSHITHE